MNYDNSKSSGVFRKSSGYKSFIIIYFEDLKILKDNYIYYIEGV